MTGKSWEEQLNNQKKWLAEPFMDMFDENTFRIRRNLLALSTVVLCYKLASDGVDLKSTTSIFGLNLKGVEESSIDWILLLGLVYFLFHFVWSAWDKLNEWKLRLTGMPVATATHGTYSGGGPETGTDNQWQSTLSSWWAGNYHENSSIQPLIKSLQVAIEEKDVKQITPSINSINTRLDQLIEKGVHIENYLERYEKGFSNLNKSQLIRWMVYEFALPILLGGAAIIVLLVK